MWLPNNNYLFRGNVCPLSLCSAADLFKPLLNMSQNSSSLHFFKSIFPIDFLA